MKPNKFCQIILFIYFFFCSSNKGEVLFISFYIFWGSFKYYETDYEAWFFRRFEIFLIVENFDIRNICSQYLYQFFNFRPKTYFVQHILTDT